MFPYTIQNNFLRLRSLHGTFIAASHVCLQKARECECQLLCYSKPSPFTALFHAGIFGTSSLPRGLLLIVLASRDSLLPICLGNTSLRCNVVLWSCINWTSWTTWGSITSNCFHIHSFKVKALSRSGSRWIQRIPGTPGVMWKCTQVGLPVYGMALCTHSDTCIHT